LGVNGPVGAELDITGDTLERMPFWGTRDLHVESVKDGVSCDTRGGVHKRDVYGGNARTEMAVRVASRYGRLSSTIVWKHRRA
jgi:hypothetical protein